MTELSDEQKEVIRGAIAGLHRRQIIPLVKTDDLQQTAEFWLVRHLTNEPLCMVGIAHDLDGISALADAIGSYLNVLFEAASDDGAVQP